MAILTKQKILEEYKAGNIIINPFKESMISDISVDITLGNHLLVYDEEIVETKKQNKTKTIPISNLGLVLEPGQFYLGFAHEIVGTTKYGMFVKGKSSVGRAGLTIENAGVGEPGFGTKKSEQWTLELIPHKHIRVYPGMPIGQVVFFELSGQVSIYSGKYIGQKGATATKIYKDFNNL